MIHAKVRHASPSPSATISHVTEQVFAVSRSSTYRERAFNTVAGEEGGPEDRPLIVQFCANDPEELLISAKALEPHCDAIDINLGCPQDIARRGHYGAYLQDDWALIFDLSGFFWHVSVRTIFTKELLVNTLHRNLSIPVTAKFRVYPTVEKTVEYSKMLEEAGAQILSCHGRTREQRGRSAVRARACKRLTN